MRRKVTEPMVSLVVTALMLSCLVYSATDASRARADLEAQRERYEELRREHQFLLGHDAGERRNNKR